MRTVNIGDHVFEVRGLTRGEVRRLRSAGISLLEMTALTMDETMDAVFDLVFSNEDLARIDTIENREVGRLLGAVVAETYGSPGEEKNLLPSGDGQPTPTGGNTAGSAG